MARNLRRSRRSGGSAKKTSDYHVNDIVEVSLSKPGVIYFREFGALHLSSVCFAVVLILLIGQQVLYASLCL